MLGLSSDEVVLVSAHSAWAEQFTLARQMLLKALGSKITAVEHVGSTAIPGVPAKPILDIQVGVQNFEEARNCIEPMEALDFEYRGEYGIARRHYFVKGNPRTHHVHILETGAETWPSMLVFRDALLAQPSLANEYAEEKLRLAAAFHKDRAGYQEAKDLVVARILEKLSALAQPTDSRGFIF